MKNRKSKNKTVLGFWTLFFGFLVSQLVLLSIPGCGRHNSESTQDDDAKIKKAQKALEKEYNNPKTHTYLGVLYEKKGLPAQSEKHYRIAIELDPHSTEAYLNLGNLYFKEKDFPGAIQILKKGFETAPDDAQLHYLLATIFRETKQYSDAIPEYQKVLDKEPQNVLAQNFMGVIYYELKEFEKAEEAFQKTIALDPSYADAYGNLGILYDFNLHDQKKAIVHYEKFLELKSQGENVALIRDLLGKAKEAVEKPEKTQIQQHIETEQPEQIETKQEKVKQEDASQEQNLFEEAKTFYEQAQYQEAIPKLESFLKNNPSDKEAKIFLALAKSRSSAPAESIKILKKAKEENKNSADLWYELALLYDQENLPETLKTYEETIHRFPKDSRAEAARKRIQDLKPAPTILPPKTIPTAKPISLPKSTPPASTPVPVPVLKVKETKAPMPTKEPVMPAPVKTMPTTSPPVPKGPKIQKQSMIYFNQGAAYQEKGQNLQAILAYQKSIMLDPSNIKAHYNLGILYKWKGDLSSSTREYNAVIKLDPSYAPAHYNLGILLKLQGRLDDAILRFKRAIQSNPRYSEAYLGIGLIYGENKKQPQNAVFYYKKYLELNPHGSTANKIRAWLHSRGEGG